MLTQLANKSGRLYMWGVMRAITAAYTAALAAIGVLLTDLPVLHMPREEEAKKTEAQFPRQSPSSVHGDGECR